MNILAITDLFITKDLLTQEILKRFENKPDLTIEYVESDWPLADMMNNNEVKEFVGSEDEIAEKAKSADIIINHVGPITKKVFEKATNLKLVAVMRGGPVNVNVEEATKRNVQVVNAPGRNGPVVAEYTIGMILSAVHNIAFAHENMKRKNWASDYYILEKSGFELKDKVLGLIGFGAIGSRVAELIKPFGMEILVFDPYVNKALVEKVGASVVPLNELLALSDIISLHSRVTKETTHMIAKPQFEKMKKGVVFINTARGGLVNYDDLITYLQNKHIGCAALDTFDTEPLPDSSLLYSFDNVILTPHIGGSSQETALRGINIVLDDVERFLKNIKLLHPIN